MPVLKNSARCEENPLSTTMGSPLRATIEGLETLTTEYRKPRLLGEEHQTIYFGDKPLSSTDFYCSQLK